jgi:hypothetical protein
MSELIDVVSEVRASIDIALRKQITVIRGTPFSADELAALERELGARFPADYEELALLFGALLFRRDSAFCCMFGKPSPETEAVGLDLDLRTQTLGLRQNEILFEEDAAPSAILALGARIDETYGHFELLLGDADGRYRQLFHDDRVSGPRALSSTWGMFPFFTRMFDDAGERLSGQTLVDALTKADDPSV